MDLASLAILMVESRRLVSVMRLTVVVALDHDCYVSSSKYKTRTGTLRKRDICVKKDWLNFHLICVLLSFVEHLL